jgi:hypothetical protein
VRADGTDPLALDEDVGVREPPALAAENVTAPDE